MQHPLRENTGSGRLVEPCVVVIFGATGDLTGRKLMPAIYNLKREGALPPQFACVGFARRQKTHDEFRKEMHDAINTHSRVKPIDEDLWNNFKDQVYYHVSEFHEDEGYNRLKIFLATIDAQHGTRGNRIFYLATQPSYFTTICEKLKKAGLIYEENGAGPWSRVIIEKPFGHDLKSAGELQKDLTQHLSENQIYRIDHYLGKETVQNLLVFRFANSLFESHWNNRYVSHVQITVAEDIGIGTRGAFWEETGLMRDIVQNHLMQLVSLVAMEPPVSLSAADIRNEKVKVLEAIRPLDIANCAVRGQYGPGYIGGADTIGYRQEKNVNPQSNVETFAALKLYIDNWRWDKVPFYLRAGKRLPKRTTEIAIVFNDPPGVLFQSPTKKNEANVLAIRIQPDEGTALKINCKVPGAAGAILPVKMDFKYGSYFGTTPPEAYERLICDCIAGDSTLFAGVDEVMNSWRLLTPLLDSWANTPAKEFPNYPAGSWGPAAADEMLAKDGKKWRMI